MQRPVVALWLDGSGTHIQSAQGWSMGMTAGIGLAYSAHAAQHRTKQARALMTPDEVLNLPEDEQILFISGLGLAPVRANKRPYFTRHEMAAGYLPNARTPNRKNLNADFPLRGAVVCGHCDTPLTACWSKGRLDYHPYYLCRKRGCECYGKSIRRSVIEGDFERLLQTMQPSVTLFTAARAMFKDLWDHRLATGAERTKALKAELVKVNSQVEQFLDRIAETTVPSVIAAYETRIKSLEDRKIMLTEKIATTGRPVRSFDETLRTAFDFLASPWKLWVSDRLEDKRTVLKLAFADRLAYVRNEGFRTPSFSLPFKALGNFEGQEFEMARPAGIEPATPAFGGQYSIH